MSELDGVEHGDRRITLSYAAALLLLAAIAIAAHWAQGRVIEQQYRSAEVVNVAGRQRMLTQRIAWSVAALPDYDGAVGSAAAQRLEDAVAQLLQGHERLLRGALAWAPADPMAAALRQHYYGGQQSLDARVRRFAESFRLRGWNASPQACSPRC
jgi:hypothetical protein